MLLFLLLFLLLALRLALSWIWPVAALNKGSHLLLELCLTGRIQM
jgi:hypothetical protein